MKKILTTLSLLCTIVFAFAQPGTIVGKVTDTSGEALIGASVFVLGTSKGTATEQDGTFSISIASGGYTIEVSYTGYVVQQREVTVESDKRTTADFRLEEGVTVATGMCGSGIIESGIRRIINLRFKNSPAFWKQENVERLFFLRGILLSFRWKTMMNNLVKLPY